MHKSKKLIDLENVPRGIIQLVDCAILASSFALSYFFFIRFEFNLIHREHFFIYIGLFSIVAYIVFYFTRIHTGLIRYSNIQDIFRIFLAVLITSLIYLLIDKLIVAGVYNIHSLNIVNVLSINFFIASSLLIFLRASIKELFQFASRIGSLKRERVLIYGTDSNALFLKRTLESTNNSFNIIGFLDINGKKRNSSIEQKRIYQIKDLPALKTKHQLDKLLLINENLGGQEKKRIIDHCLQLGIKLIKVPTSEQWVSGKLNSSQLQDLKAEDLLQRPPILINNKATSKELFGKNILVTGAAGSIGSELVRQILKFKPKKVILCDQAESALNELQLEIKEKYPDSHAIAFIGSVQNYKRMEELFKQFQPHVVFHAAAYKHVPMMEDHPSEAVLTNVLGTKNIADLSIIFGIEKFVMISTDKAINPTNVMGASKRIAEMYVQSINSFPHELFEEHEVATAILRRYLKNSNTKFITTRFGNVLGSIGSVLPRFRAQIQNGGPVTVTHPEITRYFMTIPEAVQLVLEAGTMGNGGEIYVFDMGMPVKILDLATQMIRLAGFEPNKDIKIEFSGLRAGEKLYEELLNDKESTLPTHHQKIKIANVIAKNAVEVLYDVDELINLCNYGDAMRIVKKMKEMVLEYKSNNSQFECLDHTTNDHLFKENKVNRAEPTTLQ